MSVTRSLSVRSHRKPRGDGHLRRGEILEAAERIFLAEGYEGATIRKIADAVGLSSTALYMHFRDKDEILVGINISVLEMLDAMSDEIAQRPVAPVARLRMMLETYMDFALNRPNTYRLVFCASPAAGAMHEKPEVRRLSDSCIARFEGLIGEVAAEGRLRTPHLKAAHQVFWASCHGLVTLLISKPENDWEDRDRLKAVLLDALLFGLVTD